MRPELPVRSEVSGSFCPGGHGEAAVGRTHPRGLSLLGLEPTAGD